MSVVPYGFVRITIETEKNNGSTTRSSYLTREVTWMSDRTEKADPVFDTPDVYHDVISFDHEDRS